MYLLHKVYSFFFSPSLHWFIIQHMLSTAVVYFLWNSSGLTCKKTVLSWISQWVSCFCFCHHHFITWTLVLVLYIFLKIHKEILLWNRVLTCKLILAVFVSFLSISSMFLFLWPQPTLDITIIPFLRIRILCYVTQAVKQSLSQSLCGVPKALKCFSNLMILNFSLTNTSASSKNHQAILFNFKLIGNIHIS